MAKIGIVSKSFDFKPEESPTFTIDDITQIDFCLYYKPANLNYVFEVDDDLNKKSHFSFNLSISGKIMYPMHSIIKIKIYGYSTEQTMPFKYAFNQVLLNEEDIRDIKQLKTSLFVSQCCEWSSMKIVGKCLFLPYQKIPTGLRSQYSLCYLNSVIQMLYNIPKFRQIIFSYPTKNLNRRHIVFALQRLFSQMSINSYENNFSKDFAPSAKELTESFGWTNDDLVEEQDAFEFLTIFLEKLQTLLLPFPDLTNQLNELFNGQCSSEDFNLYSVELSKDLNYSLKLAIHPNYKENYAQLYFAIKKFIEIANNKELMPQEYKILADALISILNMDNKNSSNDNKSAAVQNNSNENNNKLNNKTVSFKLNNNENNELNASIVKILKDNLKSNINKYCLKLASALKKMANSNPTTKCVPKIVTILSDRLSSIINNSEPNESFNNDNIVQLICDFYLDDQVKKLSTEVNYFVKLPKVLAIQIRRFSDQNGIIVKSNDCFKFSETLSMKEYLIPQNQNNDDDSEYELISVISHRGDLDKGHYIEFSRPTSNGSFWFKFDGEIVTPVSKYEAINGNYGENPNVIRSLSLGSNYSMTPIPTLKKNNENNALIPRSKSNFKSPAILTPKKQNPIKDQPLSAYILLYVRKKYINEILDIDVPIPNDLKMVESEITAPIVQPDKPKTNIIRLTTSENISKLILTDHFCMTKECIFSNCEIIIDNKEDNLEIIKDLYDFVASKISQNFVLWHCTHGFNPLKPLNTFNQKIEEAIRSYYDTFILIQKTGNQSHIERPFTLFDSLFYVLFFDPFNQNDESNFKYLGLIDFNIDMSVNSIFDSLRLMIKSAGIVKNPKGKNSNDELAVFYEKENKKAIYLPPNISVKAIFKRNCSTNLIVQFLYEVEDFQVDLSKSDDYALNGSFCYEDGDSYSKYMMKLRSIYSFNPLFVSYYYNMKFDSFDITFHRISTLDHISLKVLKNASIEELSRILYRVFFEMEESRHLDSPNRKKETLIAMQPVTKYLKEVKALINSKEEGYFDINENNKEKESNIEKDRIENYVLHQENVLIQLFYTSKRVLYPSTVPIDAPINSEVRSFLPQFQKHIDVFFDFFPPSVIEEKKESGNKNENKNEDNNDNESKKEEAKEKKNLPNKISQLKLPPKPHYPTIRVEISDDSITYQKMLQVAVEKGQTTYLDIATMIGIEKENLFGFDSAEKIDDDTYRILLILKSKIVTCVSNYNEKIREEDCRCYVLRFEKIPQIQRNLEGKVRVRVHYAIRVNSCEVKLFGVPFYFAFHIGEDQESVFNRLRENFMKFMKPDEKTEFVITNAQLKIMKDASLNSFLENMVDNHISSWCICILMNGRVPLADLIAMEKSISNRQLKIYT